jgi:hypothetical protein
MMALPIFFMVGHILTSMDLAAKYIISGIVEVSIMDMS